MDIFMCNCSPLIYRSLYIISFSLKESLKLFNCLASGTIHTIVVVLLDLLFKVLHQERKIIKTRVSNEVFLGTLIYGCSPFTSRIFIKTSKLCLYLSSPLILL